jgi:DNA invertase Pin-like site-specific DNA recombinase
MITAVYVRVSTVGQNDTGQRREIQRWLENNNINLANVHWYVDKCSGKDLNRPEFKQMQKDILNGNVSTVVAWKLDRLSRDLKDGLSIVGGWCEMGVRLVVVSQQLDFSSTMGQMMAAILFAFAKIEREHIKERQAIGIAIAKEKGLYKGRPKGATKAGVDTKRAIELRERGFTQKEIARSLGVSVSSVRRYLTA